MSEAVSGVAVTPTGLKLWIAGARPRTLPASVVPVMAGTAVAWWWWHHLNVWRGLLSLLVALGMQIGTNYANDYSDGLRGTDDIRVGPVRLVGSGLASGGAVKRAAWLSFGMAGIAGLILAAEVGWWLLAVGALCLTAGWLYTGGPKPYGYLGLGEVFVFVFFGLVATLGTMFVELDPGSSQWVNPAIGIRSQIAALPSAGTLVGITVGLLATALLEANNLRDIATDLGSGKRTLAARLGRKRAGWLYVGSLAGAFVSAMLISLEYNYWALLVLVSAPLAIRPISVVLSPAEGRDLVPVLKGTARIQLATGVLLVLAFVLAGAFKTGLVG